MRKYLYLLLVTVFTLNACQKTDSSELKIGMWRGAVVAKSGNEIPFNFEVKNVAGKPVIEIINGSNRLEVDEITQRGDSLFIVMPFFDSHFEALIKGDSLTGIWTKRYASENMVMPFKAAYGQEYRILKAPDSAEFDISGRWASHIIRKDDTTFAIGEFTQNGTHLSGTFLTATGDYRYLEGTVSGDKMYLSSFDGGFVYLFKADITDSTTIENGKFYSGLNSEYTWQANKDAKAELPDAYSLTHLKEGSDKLNFTFVDLNGDSVSLSDPKYKDKVVIVEFFGSWCPNCIDEMRFLSSFYQKYKDKGVEIIGLAYERTTDFGRSKKQVMRLKNSLGVQYDLLITGYIPRDVEQSLPQLRNFVSFPTTIIIDKKGDVRQIHAGFSGPGTGEHYQQFVDEFTKLIDKLLSEKI